MTAPRTPLIRGAVAMVENKIAHIERDRILERITQLEKLVDDNTKLTREVATTSKEAQLAVIDIREKAEASYAMTTEIRDLLRAGKAGLAVLKYLGLLATPIVALATAWHYFMGGK